MRLLGIKTLALHKLGCEWEVSRLFVGDFENLLLPGELEYLIAALRRDIRSERDKAALRPQMAAYHLRNVRLSVRLLEAFGHVEDKSLPKQSGIGVMQ
jgi:hypothetical protein